MFGCLLPLILMSLLFSRLAKALCAKNLSEVWQGFVSVKRMLRLGLDLWFGTCLFCENYVPKEVGASVDLN